MKAELTTDIGPLRLKNPVMPASGTYDWFGDDPAQVRAGSLGAVVTKSVTLEPQPGNPPIRVAETPSGMLNAIGIPSVGIEEFLGEVLPKYRRLDTAVIVSVQAYSPEECERMVARLDGESRVDALELNLVVSQPGAWDHNRPVGEAKRGDGLRRTRGHLAPRDRQALAQRHRHR